MKALLKKPEWLNKKISLRDLSRMKTLLGSLGLNTVCQQAACPNISECFSKGEATFLILGKICTRNCKFCAVEKGVPLPPDPDEPVHIAEAVKRLGLKHVVITTVTRDDLPDGGAEIFTETIYAIRKRIKGIIIEVLIPDFKGNKNAIEAVVDASPKIIGHNIETVPGLYREVRPMADYNLSLGVLKTAKLLGEKKGIYTKSGIMLGLSETNEEVLKVFSDLQKVCCDFLSIGQYLVPSKDHYPVKEYIIPEIFEYYKNKALEMGFLYVASGPYVRSSYLAHEYLNAITPSFAKASEGSPPKL